jgi:exodeoxyribonuclease VII small subunit
MPKSTKSKPSAVPDEPETFEEAYQQLEAIVETMESGELPLNELIERYEQGTRLFAACNTLLGSARKKLEMITLKANANHQRQAETTGDDHNEDDADDASAATPRTAASSGSADLDDDDDDIRLF